jgi:hypothetical protein
MPRIEHEEKLMKKYLMIFALGMMALSTAAFAGTTAVNTNTVAPTLQISATIQKAVQLTLSTGTAAVTHCTVTATGGTPDYTMNFGTVDALGINTGNCNKFNPANPGVDNAIYWSDYNVTPIFTSHAAISGTTITAQVTTNFGVSNIFIVRDSANSSTVPANAAAFTALGTASADTIAGPGVTSGTALTRFIGVAVKPDNGATVGTGAQSATVTFTLTVQ